MDVKRSISRLFNLGEGVLEGHSAYFLEKCRTADELLLAGSEGNICSECLDICGWVAAKTVIPFTYESAEFFYHTR